MTPKEPELPLGGIAIAEVHVIADEREEASPDLPPTPKESVTLVTTTGIDVRSLMLAAIEKGQGKEVVEVLERLLGLEERVQERAAAAEFAAALARFQSLCPPVPKDAKGKNTGRESGIEFEYRYSKLPTIAKHIAPWLKDCGLSYKWDTEVAENNLTLTTTCTVRHVSGHAEGSSCKMPISSKGGMSEQQKMSAARTFAERLSLIEALGITTADPDVDGQEQEERQPRITEQQALDLQCKAEEVGMDKDKFFAIFAVQNFKEIRVSQFSLACQTLEKRRQRHTKDGTP